jgi:hypothetical protein
MFGLIFSILFNQSANHEFSIWVCFMILILQILTRRKFLKGENLILITIGMLSLLLVEKLNSLDSERSSVRNLENMNLVRWLEDFDAGLSYSQSGQLIWTDWHDNSVSQTFRDDGVWE